MLLSIQVCFNSQLTGLSYLSPFHIWAWTWTNYICHSSVLPNIDGWKWVCWAQGEFEAVITQYPRHSSCQESAFPWLCHQGTLSHLCLLPA